MKRILLAAALVLCTFSASAQIISSSSLVVTRAKLPDVKRGYQQSVDLSYNAQIDEKFGSSVDINYIGGMRFNNTFFLGLGTGASIDITKKDDVIGVPDTPMPVNTLNIPLYAHFRVYLLNKRCTPFLALSAGGRFSTKRSFDLELGEVKYSTIGLYLNPMIGVAYRMTAKSDFYFSVGFRGQTMPELKKLAPTKAEFKSRFQYGADAHIGFSF